MKKRAHSDIQYDVKYADGRSATLFITRSELKGRDRDYPKYWAIKQQLAGRLPAGEIVSIQASRIQECFGPSHLERKFVTLYDGSTLSV
jgi:hypothetical protein